MAQKTISNEIEDFSKSGSFADSTIFRDFEGDESDTAGRRVYDVVSDQIADFVESGNFADSHIFRDFEGDESDAAGGFNMQFCSLNELQPPATGAYGRGGLRFAAAASPGSSTPSSRSAAGSSSTKSG